MIWLNRFRSPGQLNNSDIIVLRHNLLAFSVWIGVLSIFFYVFEARGSIRFTGVEKGRCFGHCQSTVFHVLSTQHSTTLQEFDTSGRNPKVEWAGRHGTDGNLQVLYRPFKHVRRQSRNRWTKFGLRLSTLSSKCNSKQEENFALFSSRQTLSRPIAIQSLYVALVRFA